MNHIQENLQDLRQEIADIARKAGRNPADITLVAVSKTKPIEAVQQAIEAEQVHFGENRAREMRDKQAIEAGVKWHMIGRLQTNKIKYFAPFVHLVHSVDAEKILVELDKEGNKNERVIDCLLQINISNEDQKGGFNEAEAWKMIEKSSEYPSARIIGLMGMAEFTDDETVIRNQFRKLKGIFDRFARAGLPENVRMDTLSMGMSGDFHIAIEEGATLLRVGSKIFGERNYN